MRIDSLQIENFRSIENLTIEFPHFYTALCGKNDAGKSNVIRVMQFLFKAPGPPFFDDEDHASLETDLPNWKMSSEGPQQIVCKAKVQILLEDDEGLYRFLESYLQLPPSPAGNSAIRFGISIRYTAEGPKIAARINDQDLEELKSQEIFKKIKTSFGVLFHDSTRSFFPYQIFETARVFREIPANEEKKIAAAKAALEKVWSRVARQDQEELSGLLGRLNDKYKIGLTVKGGNDMSRIPYQITLGTGDKSVRLENWGSGTQNRTQILMALFKAKRIRSSATSATKITPVIVIEEPESYLHPSAQAEFGSILRDLAEEFQVQVIVTTHSPYLLNLSAPSANVLLQRESTKGRSGATVRTNTSGEHWAEPFSLALGMGSDEIAPWRDVFFTKKDKIILVEGDLDAKYLKWLQDERHGDKRLAPDVAVFAYGGSGALAQKELVRAIFSRFQRVVVTYDLDKEKEVQKPLKTLGLTKGRDYISVGQNAPGSTCIEGLLPKAVVNAVLAENADLAATLVTGTADDTKSAKGKLKKLYCERLVQDTTLFGSNECRDFYELSRQLNKMLKEPRHRP